MKYRNVIKEDFDRRKHEYVLEFIRKKNVIKSEDNIIFSEKAFVINSVIKLCLDKVKNKKMTMTQWSKFRSVLGQYIADIVDIKWKDGFPEIIEVNNDKAKRTRRSSRKK